jgi:putative exosortase-associated protein (TIGR04073 family)
MHTFRRSLTVFLLVALLASALPAAAFADTQSANFLTKLMRGAINTITGWVEIPKNISQVSNEEGAGAGWTRGLLRGLGYGFVRTAAGVYEVVTFPFPAPVDYEPLMQPEFVFESNSSDQGL